MTPAGRGPGARGDSVAAGTEPSEGSSEPEQRPPHVAIDWAWRLRRVFGLDIERCAGCGGTLRIIACIEERVVIEKILAHLRHASHSDSSGSGVSEARGPPYWSAALWAARHATSPP